MRTSRTILFWSVIIVVIVILEVLEVTHVFTLGFASILAEPLAFVFAVVLITVLALVGALFVGIYIAHRILSPGGFTPFEEEMLRMKDDLKKVSEELKTLNERLDERKGPK
jgi:type VI protein secretion system component VasK